MVINPFLFIFYSVQYVQLTAQTWSPIVFSISVDDKK